MTCNLSHFFSLLWRDSHSLSHMPTVANSSRAIIIGIPQVICHHNIELHVLSSFTRSMPLLSKDVPLDDWRSSWKCHHSKVIDHHGLLLIVHLSHHHLIHSLYQESTLDHRLSSSSHWWRRTLCHCLIVSSSSWWWWRTLFFFFSSLCYSIRSHTVVALTILYRWGSS